MKRFLLMAALTTLVVPPRDAAAQTAKVPPNITSVTTSSPPAGSSGVFYRVELRGTGFTGAHTLQLVGPGGITNGVIAFKVQSDDRITADMPMTQRDPMLLRYIVGTPLGYAEIAAPEPKLTNMIVSPPAAARANVVYYNVVLEGSALSGITTLQVYRAGGVSAGVIPFVIESDQRITAEMPITMKVFGPVRVMVMGHGGAATINVPMSIAQPPQLTSVALTTPGAGRGNVAFYQFTMRGVGFRDAHTLQLYGPAGMSKGVIGFNVESDSVITGEMPLTQRDVPLTRYMLGTPYGYAQIVAPPPKLMSVTASAPNTGKENTVYYNLTLNGTALSGITTLQVILKGGVPGDAIPFAIISDTRITAEMPIAQKTTGIIRYLVMGHGGAAEIAVATYTPPPAGPGIVPPPIITSFSPTIVDSYHSIRIEGEHLRKVTDVSVGAARATISGIPSDNSISIKFVNARPQMPGGLITVRTPTGVTTSKDSLFIAVVVDSVRPKRSGPGSVVYVFGVGLKDGDSMTFGGGVTAPLSLPGAVPHVTVPAGAQTGPVTPPGRFVIVRDTLSIVPPPIITSFSPTSVSGYQSVRIKGANLGTVKDVTVASVHATISGLPSEHEISIKFPNGPPSPGGLITVRTLGGVTTSTDSLFAAVIVDSIRPKRSGPGSVVYVFGSGLKDGDSMTFGGGVTAPLSLPGAVPHVTVPAGAQTGPVTPPGRFVIVHDTLQIIPPPVITSFSPTSVSGYQSVRIQGNNLGSVKDVTVASVHATISGLPSEHEISIKFPNGPPSPGGLITVRTLGGVTTSTDSLLKAVIADPMASDTAPPAVKEIKQVLRSITSAPGSSPPLGRSSCDGGCFDAVSEGEESRAFSGHAVITQSDGSRYQIALTSKTHEGHYLRFNREEGGVPQSGSFVLTNTCGEAGYTADLKKFTAEYVLNDYKGEERIAYDGRAGTLKLEVTPEYARGTFSVTTCRDLGDNNVKTIRLRGTFEARF